MIDLSVKIGSLTLKNPVTVASGTFGYGEEFNENFYPIKKLGAVFTKGISLKPREGNPMPRVVETPSGMINAIGLANVGLEKFISEKLPYLKRHGATTIVNIFGTTKDEYRELAERLSQEEGVSALEINISCPNVKSGGLEFGTVPQMAAEVTAAVKRVSSVPVIVKLSPNVSDIKEIASAVIDEGADALSAINTITAMSIDVNTRSSRIANIVGGLSGPAIKPIALRFVWQLCQRLKVPVIGIGGISSLEDMLEYFIVGASAVQIGTANFREPLIAKDLINELEVYCNKNRISSIDDIRGTLKV